MGCRVKPRKDRQAGERGAGQGDTGESKQKNPLGSEVALSRSLDWEGAGLERPPPSLWGIWISEVALCFLPEVSDSHSRDSCRMSTDYLTLQREFPLPLNSHGHAWS